jgi:hypothetical protein
MKKLALPMLLLLGLLVLAFVGCKPASVSVEDRIALFLSDINNANWSSIYLNFHPTLTQDYPEISNNTYPDWTALFPTEYSPYSIIGLNTSDPRNVTGSMTASNAAWGGPQAVVFRMAQYGEDWMIEGMDLGLAIPLIK